MSYQVLARKWRPHTFEQVVGQHHVLTALTNALDQGRLHHAYLLSGTRGVGKTTIARILAKSLNCEQGISSHPCGVCDTCREIDQGNFVDLLEIDAASRTKVEDTRELLDNVQYSPARGRYKVYLIDEVHMLSQPAFNALLKTLEEPPAHVKFIFATTEIRKVPVTVLSRCQRFDLKRIEPEVMMALLSRIAAGEGAQISEGALALITRAAEGSARDATSLLDQAISNGAGETSADQVRAMLGLADRGRVLDLFDMIMRGAAPEALAEISAQYADGADPMAVLRDLAEITHWISVIKITPEAAEDPTTPPEERTRGLEMAGRLPMRVLSRMWQMLLKAIEQSRSRSIDSLIKDIAAAAAGLPREPGQKKIRTTAAVLSAPEPDAVAPVASAPAVAPTPSRVVDVPIEDSGLLEDSLPPLDVEAAETEAAGAERRADFVFPESALASLPVAEVGKTAFPGDKEFIEAVESLPPGLKDKLKTTIGADFTALRPVPVGKLRRPL